MKIGVIGLGSIAHQIYFPTLFNIGGDIEITAIMSRTQKSVTRTKKIYNIEFGTNNFSDFINKSMDCVLVLTPKDHHKEFIIPLLNKGVHVLCEKPMAGSLDDAKDILNAAKKSKAKLMFVFNRRFMDVYKIAKTEFQNSFPDMMICQKNRPGKEYRSTLENTIHMIDLLSWFCGEPHDISAKAKFEDPYYETQFGGLIEFRSGSLGLVSASRKGRQWEELVDIYGCGKTVRINAPNNIQIFRQSGISGYSYIGENTGFVDAKDTMGFTNAIKHFFECVKEDKEPLTNAQSSFNTQKLLNLLLEKSGLPTS